MCLRLQFYFIQLMLLGFFPSKCWLSCSFFCSSSPRNCRILDGEQVSYRVYHIDVHTCVLQWWQSLPCESSLLNCWEFCWVFPFPGPQLISVKNVCFTVCLNLLILACSKVLQTYCLKYFNCLVTMNAGGKNDYSLV